MWIPQNFSIINIPSHSHNQVNVKLLPIVNHYLNNHGAPLCFMVKIINYKNICRFTDFEVASIDCTLHVKQSTPCLQASHHILHMFTNLTINHFLEYFIHNTNNLTYCKGHNGSTHSKQLTTNQKICPLLPSCKMHMLCILLHGLHIYIWCHLYEFKVNISVQYQTLKCTLTCENYVSTLHHQVQ
jgi:hypothetical protein